ncbi:hypothetical protein OUZ56_016306 [Daphnia magna]|uniref:Uncharacterized protein n=1 Tax=Daphnia magna TaxID=35525 RepID=A0ABR0AQD1_9CRUS|nr:hypothetical protein OUZ56_016306 [Daphnia magna]
MVRKRKLFGYFWHLLFLCALLILLCDSAAFDDEAYISQYTLFTSLQLCVNILITLAFCQHLAQSFPRFHRSMFTQTVGFYGCLTPERISEFSNEEISYCFANKHMLSQSHGTLVGSR